MLTSMNQFAHLCSSVRHCMLMQPVKPMSRMYVSAALPYRWLPIGSSARGYRAASLRG